MAAEGRRETFLIGGVSFRNVPVDNMQPVEMYFTVLRGENEFQRFMGMQQYLEEQGLPLLSQVIVDRDNGFYAFSEDRSVGWVNIRSRLYQFIHGGKATYMPNQFRGFKHVPGADQPGMKSQQPAINQAMVSIRNAVQKRKPITYRDLRLVSVTEIEPELLLQVVDTRQSTSLLRVIRKSTEDDNMELAFMVQLRGLHLMERIVSVYGMDDHFDEDMTQSVLLLLYLCKRHNQLAIRVPRLLVELVRISASFHYGAYLFNKKFMYRDKLVGDSFILGNGISGVMTEWLIYSVERDAFVPFIMSPEVAVPGAAVAGIMNDMEPPPGESGKKIKSKIKKIKNKNKRLTCSTRKHIKR